MILLGMQKVLKNIRIRRTVSRKIKKKLECVQCALYNHHTLHISFFPTLTTQNPQRSCLEVTMYLMWMVVRIPVGNTTNLHYNFVVAKPLVHIILKSVKNSLVYQQNENLYIHVLFMKFGNLKISRFRDITILTEWQVARFLKCKIEGLDMLDFLCLITYSRNVQIEQFNNRFLINVERIFILFFLLF